MSENSRKQQLTDSELAAIRVNLKEEDHIRWLISWIKTLGTWIGAGLSLMWAGIEGVTKLIDWLAKR